MQVLVKSRRAVAVLAAASVVALGVAADPASAATSTHATTSISSKGEMFNDAGLSDALVARYDQYVRYSSSSGFSLALPASVRAGSSVADLATLGRAISAGNAQLARATGSFGITLHGTTLRTGAMRPDSTSGAHGGVSFSWWGVTLWLDEWATGRLEAGLAAGSGAAWVAAELLSWTGVGGLSGGAIAALLALGSGGVWLCDWNGRGVGFHLGYWGSGWCWPR